MDSLLAFWPGLQVSGIIFDLLIIASSLFPNWPLIGSIDSKPFGTYSVIERLWKKLFDIEKSESRLDNRNKRACACEQFQLFSIK